MNSISNGKEKINSFNNIFHSAGWVFIVAAVRVKVKRSLSRSTVPKFINFLLPSKIEILSTKLKLMAFIMLIST